MFSDQETRERTARAHDIGGYAALEREIIHMQELERAHAARVR